jgi:lipopolysaccharide biosynthesis regulator YciM
MTIDPATESRMPMEQATGAATLGRPLPACPLCGAQLSALFERCPSCGGGLLTLLRVAELADFYFNQAVTAAREEKWWQAGEHLAVTLALRPDDVDALVLLGKIRCQQQIRGSGDLAVATWKKALCLAPDRTDIKSAIDSVTRARGKITRARGKKGKR